MPGSEMTLALIATILNSSVSDTGYAVLRSFVIRYDAKPTLPLFALFITLSSVLNFANAISGLNVSSPIALIELSISLRTVNSQNFGLRS